MPYTKIFRFCVSKNNFDMNLIKNPLVLPVVLSYEIGPWCYLASIQEIF